MTFRRHPPETPATWIVVADRSRARILSSADDHCTDLRELDDLINPVGAMRQSEVVSDQQGYLTGRAGLREACEPQTDFEHKVAEPFAQQIVKRLEAGRNRRQFGHLILISSPLFLGTLRQKLSQPLARMVNLEVDKDYSKRSIADITACLAKLRSVPE